MNREDIIFNNNFEFVEYKKARDKKNINRFILIVSDDKQCFFESIFKKNQHQSFLLKDDIFYISNEIKSYAFKLDKDFEEFVNDMVNFNIHVFNISFAFPSTTDVYDFSFLGEI